MRQKVIGRITTVLFNKIIFEIFDTDELTFNYKGDLYKSNGLNDFITIYKDSKTLYIYQVTGLFEKEKPFSEIEYSKFEEKAYFEAVPVGELTNNGFQFGLSKYPMIGDEVSLASFENLAQILSNDAPETISFGKLLINDYEPRINVNALFSTHISILGNTGSGKSTTIRKMLNDLISIDCINPNQMNFLIFDVHNEYANLPSKFSTPISLDSFSIPTRRLDFEDWINLVNPAMAVQLPVLLNALRLASLVTSDNNQFLWIYAYCALELYNNQQTEAVAKRTKIIGLLDKINDPSINQALQLYNSQYANFTGQNEAIFKQAITSYISTTCSIDYINCGNHLNTLLTKQECTINDLKDLLAGVDLALLLEESKGNTAARSHCTTLISRIENLVFKYSKSLFDSSQAKLATFESILNFEKAFTIFDCSSLEDNDLLFFSSFIINLLLKEQILARKQSQNITKAFHFVLDEAHRYITEKPQNEYYNSITTYEKIAKEGRKFGLFLIIASQRPGELSKTVLSQCNNFILHRIRNNLDLEQLKRSIPYITDMQIYRMSYLKTGNALLVGDAFVMPIEVEIDGAIYGGPSSTLRLTDVWQKAPQ